MDAALLTQRLRNQAVALAPKQKASDKSNATTLGAQLAGAGTFWFNGLALQGGCDCTPPSTTPQPDPTPLQTFVFATQELVFQYIVSTNCGPTLASRYLYLWMTTVTSAYSWAQTTGPLTAVIDGWDWSIHHPLSNVGYVAAWMTQVLAIAMPLLVPGTTAAQLLQLERNLRLWTPLDQAVQAGYVNETAKVALWRIAWTAWFVARQHDGSVQAQALPTFSQLPNGGLLLDPAITQDISGSYPAPFQWTPLVIASIPKPYYTRTWETVQSVVLTSTDDTAAKAAAAPFFPGPNVPFPQPPTTNTTVRYNELADVVAKTGLLGLPPCPGSPTDSDVYKVLAEFWAGGPKTLTPPGQFMWMWRQYALAFQISQQTSYGYEALFYSGLDLAIHLFEMGRVAWGIKLQYTEARPIQDIRRNYATTDLSGWRTTRDPLTGAIRPAADVSGSLWLPYQAANFVTPAFPDFVSGHSAYSEVFALVMGDWYGDTIPVSRPTVATDLPLFSPILQGTQTQPFGVFQVSPGASAIQPTIVPHTPVTLTFSTFQQMATSAGLSRQWGGIHAASAHTGGQAAAQSVHASILTHINAQSTIRGRSPL